VIAAFSGAGAISDTSNKGSSWSARCSLGVNATRAIRPLRGYGLRGDVEQREKASHDSDISHLGADLAPAVGAR